MKTLVIVYVKQTGQKRCRVYNETLSVKEIESHVYKELGEKLVHWEYVEIIVY